jgi:phthalate 4,5-dioxygenase oxygenase subunit
MGDLMRQYWLPAAASGELAADGDPLRLMLLGEKLIAFRYSSGRVGVMDHRWPHRCASLFFGRNEEDGIRCVYHGWKYDVNGNCLDMANVPPHQDFKHKVKAKAYAARERAGVVWVFIGDQTRVPELPDIEATLTPDSEVNAVFIQRECSYLQSLEGSIDTSHAGFLHSDLASRNSVDGQAPDKRGDFIRQPEYEITEAPCGNAYGAFQPTTGGDNYWRVAHFLFPFWTLSPTGPIDGHVAARAWVPMDDTHNMSVYFGVTCKREAGSNRLAGGVANFSDFLPNTTDWYGRWRSAANAANDYRIDRARQRSETYSGIEGLILQDSMVTESMGGIADMRLEHLAPSDQMIAVTRKRMLQAAVNLAKSGARPPAADRPEDFFIARSGYFVADRGAKWLEAYSQRLNAARPGRPIHME